MKSFLPLVVIFFISLFFVGLWHEQSVRVATTQSSFGFDAQNAKVWQWTAQRGYLPYRDVFYPYGLVAFFQEKYPIVLLFQLLLGATSLSLVIFGLKKEIGGIFSFVIVAVFLVFVSRYIGFETWSRYGISVAACFFLPNFIRKRANERSFLVGIVMALIFALIFDQALYIGTLFISLIVFRWVSRREWSLQLFVSYVFRPISFFIFGLLLGNLPFFLYLLVTRSFSGFLYLLSYMPKISIFAKTPFLPFSLSPANIFSFSILFMSLGILSFYLIVKEKKPTMSTYVFLLLTVFSLLLEQKSIIRSIDWQITLPAFLLLAFLLAKQTRSMEGKGGWKTLSYVGATVLMVLLVFLYPFRRVYGQQLVTHGYPERYVRVLQALRTDSSFNGKVFSYPSDPIFYTLTQQQPPYFFTSYETTPREAQGRVITYLQDQDISFVVYNLNISAVQDGVPNIARNTTELKYILFHYEAWKTVDDFLILKRKNDADVRRICTFVPKNSICEWTKELWDK